MKILGIVFILGGLILFGLALYNYILHKDSVVSPIPEQDGVKVIIVTPTQ